MQINPYILFNGTCEEAFKFYAELLHGKIEVLSTYGETPAAGHVAPEWRNKVIHARLSMNGQILMASDAPPERFKPPQGFSVSLNVSSIAEAERIFAALAQGGSVGMPLGQTFWAARFGMAVDRFGIPWMVNCEAAS